MLSVKQPRNHRRKSSGKRKNEFYCTPPGAVEALLKKESFNGPIYDPCSGTGAISKVLKGKGYSVISSDLYKTVNYTSLIGNEVTENIYGNSGIDFTDLDQVKNFLPDGQIDNIIGNPPFSLFLPFILVAKEIAVKKIAFLLPLSSLAGEDRYRKVWTDKTFPEKGLYIFIKRLNFGFKDPCPDEMAWFIWEKGYTELPTYERI